MTWIASDAALIAFATAAIVEIAAYYVPWLDNVADAVAGPAAVTAGIIEMAAVTPDLPPLVRWTVAVIAGGGIAGLAQLGTTLLRLKSSTLTAGVGNPVVATGELIGSLALAALGLLAPLVAVVIVDHPPRSSRAPRDFAAAPIPRFDRRVWLIHGRGWGASLPGPR
jgi:hypothetical protein